MRSLDPASKVSSLGPGLDRVLSSNFIVIKIRMMVPGSAARILPGHVPSGTDWDDSGTVALERRILFSMN